MRQYVACVATPARPKSRRPLTHRRIPLLRTPEADSEFRLAQEGTTSALRSRARLGSHRCTAFASLRTGGRITMHTLRATPLVLLGSLLSVPTGCRRLLDSNQ